MAESQVNQGRPRIAWTRDFRPYDLRHTCASLMIRVHVGPADVAAQLGTSLELVFRTYAHNGVKPFGGSDLS